MTVVLHWQGSEDKNDRSGTATFSFGGRVLAIKMHSFGDANAITTLIEDTERAARKRASKTAAEYLRGVAAQMEQQ